MFTRSVITCIALIFWLTIGTAVAQQSVPETIEFDGAADGGASADIYPSRYTGPVKFKHSKHVEDYGATCGDCHHDDSLEPIESYDPDQIYTCIDCHDEEGLIRGPKAENAAAHDDLIEHRANVIHLQCIGCHKSHNNEKHMIRAPEACIACHAENSQDWVVK